MTSATFERLFNWSEVQVLKSAEFAPGVCTFFILMVVTPPTFWFEPSCAVPCWAGTNCVGRVEKTPLDSALMKKLDI